MEKASKALRRSGVRIRSIGSGHSDLQMVIAQLKDVRVAAKAFSTAQSSAMQDLVKWSLKDENRAIQDALTQVGELFSVWTEVQRDFSEHIKEFKHQFDMILEGAKQLDMAKTDLQTAEAKEGKLKKELKKAAKKATPEELRDMTSKLGEAEREKDLAQLEVVDRVREHEAVKMIRIKEGLFKISEAYIDYAQKCDVIFGAQRDIALQIPDVHDRDIQDIKYTGRMTGKKDEIIELICKLDECHLRSWIHHAVCSPGEGKDQEVPTKAVEPECGAEAEQRRPAASLLGAAARQPFLLGLRAQREREPDERAGQQPGLG